jgi:hypothetical protein
MFDPTARELRVNGVETPMYEMKMTQVKYDGLEPGSTEQWLLATKDDVDGAPMPDFVVANECLTCETDELKVCDMPSAEMEPASLLHTLPCSHSHLPVARTHTQVGDPYPALHRDASGAVVRVHG